MQLRYTHMIGISGLQIKNSPSRWTVDGFANFPVIRYAYKSDHISQPVCQIGLQIA